MKMPRYLIPAFWIIALGLLPVSASAARADDVAFYASRDCKDWTLLDNSTDLAQVAALPGFENFSFIKAAVRGSELVSVIGEPTDEYVQLVTDRQESKEEIGWVGLVDSYILKVWDGMVSVTPVRNDPGGLLQNRKSAMEIVVLIGQNNGNHSSAIRMSRVPDGAGVAHIEAASPDQKYLVCDLEKGCVLRQYTDDWEDLSDNAQAKADWHQDELISGITAACNYLADPANTERLSRYSQVNGACGGRMDYDMLMKNYADGTDICRLFMEKTMPKLKTFFGRTDE